MLYADKQALETDLKVCLLAIRERELDLYTQNCRSIGTSAALLAGFAYAGLSTTSDFSEDTSEFSKGLYLTVTTSAMSLNVASMAAATWCSMLGPGLALRGPDGSMERTARSDAALGRARLRPPRLLGARLVALGCSTRPGGRRTGHRAPIHSLAAAATGWGASGRPRLRSRRIDWRREHPGPGGRGPGARVPRHLLALRRR